MTAESRNPIEPLSSAEIIALFEGHDGKPFTVRCTPPGGKFHFQLSEDDVFITSSDLPSHLPSMLVPFHVVLGTPGCFSPDSETDDFLFDPRWLYSPRVINSVSICVGSDGSAPGRFISLAEFQDFTPLISSPEE